MSCYFEVKSCFVLQYMSDLRKAEDLVRVVQTEREAALKVIQPDAPALLPRRQHNCAIFSE